MRLAEHLRFTLRESRGARRRLLLFMACLAVGVAAIVAVSSLSRAMEQGIRSEARALMGADVAVSARRPLPEALDEVVAAFDPGLPGAIERTLVRELVTVVAAPPRDGAPGPSRLVELKVVDGVFPFYGELRLDPPGRLETHLAEDAVVVAAELLAPLGLAIGDELLVGGERFRIAATVLDEPDRLNFSITMGPRVFLSATGLTRANLLGQGSRVRHEALLKLPDGAGAREADALEQHLEAQLPGAASYRITSYADAQPSLRRGLARTTEYLGLVGLLSLLIGGVGVAQTVRAWIAERLDAIAVLRCLGMRPREVVLLYTVQTALLGLAGSALGAAIGTAIHVLAPILLFPDLVPPAFRHPWQPRAVLEGLALGTGVALLFSLPPLLSIRRIPPARVLRSDAEPLRGVPGIQAIAWLVLAGGIWGAATWQAGSAVRGAIFAAGLAGVVLALAGAAIALSRAIGRLPRDGGRLWLRHGLSRLARPGAATTSSIVALGVGVMIVLAMHLVERQLSGQLAADLPAKAPSTFLVDIQPDQWDPVRSTLETHGAESIVVVPLVMARIRALDGVSVEELLERRDDPGQAEPGQRPRPRPWALRREQRLTYGATLSDGNEIVAGALWSDPERAEVSVEEEFARDLGIALGSTITMEIQGVRVDLAVTSLRAVEWRTFGVNFFLVVEPGVLEDAPQMRIATARLPDDAVQAVQDELALAAPNVTVVHVRDVLDKLLAVLARLSFVVQLLGGFVVAAGVVILGGAIAAGALRRRREVAVLKAIGMTRRDVSTLFAVEYALVGLAAALIGGLGGTTLAWAVVTRVMELPWSHRPLAYAGAVAATVILAVGAGLAASARALAAKPVEVLRAL